MKRKHTKSFLLVSVAATFTGCGGSTEDGSDRSSDRQRTSEEAGMEQSNPMVIGLTSAPFYGPGVSPTAQPAQLPTQSQVPAPGMGGGDEPVFVGDPVEPDYVSPIPGTPAIPDYGGQSGVMPVGSTVAPVYVGDPVEPDYGGQGGVEQFPGLPAIPEYGGAAGQPPIGGSSGGIAIGGSSGAEAIGGASGATPIPIGGSSGAEAMGGFGGQTTGGAAGVGGSVAGDDAIGGAAN